MNFDNSISALRSKCANFWIHSCALIVILIIVQNISSVSLETIVKRTIENLRISQLNSEPLFHVIVNRNNSEVIVGARNVIYRLSSDDLNKIDEFRTGPKNDSINCMPEPMPCDTKRQLVNNDNKILLINYENKQYPLVYACGDAYQGICYILSANNLSYNKIYGSPNDTLNYIASKSSSYAFFAPSATSKQVLYVGNSYDGRPLELSPPSISSRKLSGYDGFRLTHDSSTSYTKVDLHPTYKQTFSVKYLYGFNYTYYTYFLTTQPTTVRDTQEYETKLIRICQNDTEFFSYMEIPLVCSEDERSVSNTNNKQRNVIYNIASTAYLSKVGNQKYSQLEIVSEKDSHTLFVAFKVSTMGTTFNESLGSAICAFSLKQINTAFTNAAKECLNGGTEVQILEHIIGTKRECKQIGFQVQEDFCGSGHNPYIGANRPLNGVILTSIKSEVTSLAVAIQDKKSVAVVGTNDGKVFKVLIEEKTAFENPLFKMNFSDQIRPNPVFDINEKYLYFLSGKEVVKFPFASCSLHTDCANCLNPSDPLHCGWCGSYCATNEECLYPTLMSKSMCPPELFDFTPKSGPLLGGTIVTISGDNLGKPHHSSENSNIRITIAGTDCDVIHRQPRRVQCKTNPVKKELSGSVLVTVQDLMGGQERTYDINGTAESQEEFKYLEPDLLGINPSYGPYDGGTNITIIGKNLHIGSNRTILLAGIQCKEVNNNSSFLSCISGAKSKPSDDTSVNLIIDSNELIINQNRTVYPMSDSKSIKDENVFEQLEWSEYFEYKQNPKIHSFEPKATIKSGNTNITVNGIHLDSVKNPRMKTTAFSRITTEQITSESVCRVNQFGTQMVCITSPLRDPIPPPTIKLPIATQISFILDGVKNYGLNPQNSRLIYFPDPIFSSFKESNNLRVVYFEELRLKIDGKDLSSEYPIDITIGKHEVPCNVTESLKFEAIFCIIENNEILFENENIEHSVRIKIGHKIFSPGNIIFAPKPSSSVSLGTIMVSILVPILLIGVIVTAIIYYLKTRGFILTKKYPPSVHYSPSIENGDRPSYLHQQSHNNYVREDVTHPLLSVGEQAVGGRRYQISEETMALLRAEHILIERTNINLEQVIGQGHFGCVYKGILHLPEKDVDREVAVKTLHSSIIRDEMDIESFLQEGLMMKDFRHHHVLTLIGVCFEDDGSPIVILPFMQNGDLLSYIRDEKNNPTVKNLLIFAIEIAKGMDYLSSQKFVHRDLAARNCMLDSELCVKVADFGLSRDIYERDYYSSDNKKCKLPVKWMSPESLEKGTYNTKTDVWSYGVLVWELLTRGVTPYPDVDNWEILNYLKQGRRMPRPAFCPELLYFILLRCWAEDPKLRPNFAELCDEVQGVITKLEKGAEKQKVELNKCNTYVNYPIPNTYVNDPPIEDLNQPQPQSSGYETTC